MARRTVRELADRLVGLGMVAGDKAAAVLAEIGAWRADHLDEELEERDLVGWLPEFGVAVSVHGDDVDYVEDYYRHLLEEEVTACTGGAVVVSDVVLVRGENDFEKLHFLRNGESVWWHVDHQSEDYADLAAVAEQINDLDPGGDDPRRFHHLRPARKEACFDDVYVLASPEQARALRDEYGLDFPELDVEPPAAQPAKVFLDRWLSEMDDMLDRWRSRFLPADFPFDFSLDGLGALEQLVLDRFADWSEVQAAAADPFVVGAVGYFGETLIRNGLGRWGCQDVTPQIRSNTPNAFMAIVVPLHRLCRLAEDREPGVLGKSVEELHYAADSYTTALRALDSIQ